MQRRKASERVSETNRATWVSVRQHMCVSHMPQQCLTRSAANPTQPRQSNDEDRMHVPRMHAHVHVATCIPPSLVDGRSGASGRQARLRRQRTPIVPIQTPQQLLLIPLLLSPPSPPRVSFFPPKEGADERIRGNIGRGGVEEEVGAK